MSDHMLSLRSPKTRHLLYVVLMFGGMTIGFAKWIIFSKILLPAEFGVYSALMASIAIGFYVGAVGLNEYLVQQGSSSHGKGEMREIYRLRDHSLLTGLVITVLMMIPLAAVSYAMNWWGVKPVHFAVFCALLLSTVVFGLVDAGLRAAQRTLAFAGMVCLRAVLLLALGYVLAKHLDVLGILLAELASAGAAIAVALWVWGPRPRLGGSGLDTARLKALVRGGSSFLKLQLLRYVSLTLDKWLVGWFLGALALGQYSFLLITFLAFTAFAGVYNAAIIPHLISAYSKSNDRNNLIKATKLQILIFIIICLGVGPFYLWLIDVAISRYFREYTFEHYFVSLVLIYAGSSFHVAAQLFDSFFYALDKQVELTIVAALSLALFGVYYWVVGGVWIPSVLGFSLAFFLTKMSWFFMTLLRANRINKSY